MLMANLSHDEWDALVDAARFYIVQRRTDPTTRHTEGALRKLLAVKTARDKEDKWSQQPTYAPTRT